MNDNFKTKYADLKEELKTKILHVQSRRKLDEREIRIISEDFNVQDAIKNNMASEIGEHLLSTGIIECKRIDGEIQMHFKVLEYENLKWFVSKIEEILLNGTR